jgi:DNA (cytosine-5)-methyltransferase 1
LIASKAINAEKIDAVIAGPPCQGFSRAGRRDPKDPRNREFVACARIAAKLDSNLVVFENVPYLAKPPFRRFLDKAMAILRKNGYRVESFEVEAGRFRIAQRRKRLFLLAFKRMDESKVEAAVQGLLNHTEPELTVREAWEGLPPDCGAAQAKSFKNHDSMTHSRKVEQKIARILPGTGPLSYRKLDPDMPALTLIAGHSAAPCHFAANRTITVREAARIQSFDDNFTFLGGKRSELLQVANAVPPMLAYHVAVSLLHPVSSARAHA